MANKIYVFSQLKIKLLLKILKIVLIEASTVKKRLLLYRQNRFVLQGNILNEQLKIKPNLNQ